MDRIVFRLELSGPEGAVAAVRKAMADLVRGLHETAEAHGCLLTQADSGPSEALQEELDHIARGKMLSALLGVSEEAVAKAMGSSSDEAWQQVLEQSKTQDEKFRDTMIAT